MIKNLTQIESSNQTAPRDAIALLDETPADLVCSDKVCAAAAFNATSITSEKSVKMVHICFHDATSEGNKYRRPRCTDSAACTLRQVLSIDNLTKAKLQIEKNSRRMKNRQRAEKQIEECRQWDIGKGRQKILRSQYRPQPYTQCKIPKANGGERTLNIQGTIDRIVSQSIKQVIGGVCETRIFLDTSYAYRPGRSCADILRKVREWQGKSCSYITKVDLNRFFDSIDHAILMGELRKLHAEPGLIGLLKTIIKDAKVKDPVSGKIEPIKVGIPQGGILSPLLANLYGTIIDREMIEYGDRYMRYADDIIIMCASHEECRVAIKDIQSAVVKAKVGINTDKTFTGRLTDTTVFGIGFSDNGMFVPRSTIERWFLRKRAEKDAEDIPEAFMGVLSYYLNVAPEILVNVKSVINIESVLNEQYSAAERNLFVGFYERVKVWAAERLTESPVITDECTSGSGLVA